MVRRGVIRGGERLRPTWAATTVQVRDGDVMISDGPFAEAQQQIGGYCLIECAGLDEALEVAAKIPSARQGTIEVRPIWENLTAKAVPPSSASRTEIKNRARLSISSTGRSWKG